MTIGVTGQMAAGKNAVAALLETRGWKTIDADTVTHDVIETAAADITALFRDDAAARGISLTNHDGTINRRAVGKLVFQNPALLAKQEALVYPEIIAHISAFCRAHEAVGAVINATVLYKTPQLLERCTAVLFVRAPFLVRLRRARRRDHMPYRDIIARFWSQRRLKEKYRAAGARVIIVQNGGSRRALEQEVARAYARIMQLATL
ncbi:MAG: dephospho-CoA kinase [Treponema sp.]|nr:dephospho-CoA kinase [Treponema sp.]